MDEGGISGGSTLRLQPTGGQTDEQIRENDGYYNSVKKRGRYIIPWEHVPTSNFWDSIKVICCVRNHSKIPARQELDETLSIVASDFTTTVPEQNMHVTWIGHSTTLIQMDGITILTDPIFSTRTSPCRNCCGYKRYRAPSCKISELPRIDMVLISHNHYDHLDSNSVKQLNDCFGSALQWYVPVGTAQLVHSKGCKNVIELDWWEEHIVVGHADIKVAFTPSQHWSQRGLCDGNKALWGSWCVLGPTKRFFYAGDSGYCAIFEKIGMRYGPFDLAAIPIGDYEPRDLMAFEHINPEEAVRVHQDLKAKKSLAVHWGTFPSGWEFYLEPRERLKEALQSRNIPTEEFFILKHGESQQV